MPPLISKNNSDYLKKILLKYIILTKGKFMDKKILANLILLLTALIWGISFVAQKSAMEFLQPFSFNCVRSFLGGISLIPLIFLYKITHRFERKHREFKHKQHILLAQAGLCCGGALFAAMSIQQYSMIYSDAGKAGFITSLYIIFVPMIMACFGQKLSRNIKISIALALIGLYLLCFKNTMSGFDFYDGMLLVGAFFYGVHIIVVNYFSKHLNPSKVSCLQFFVVGILSLPLMLIFENPDLQSFIACRIPILYAGILTCGVAYTLQILGQKNTAPAVASLILCLESVFAVLGGWLILNETLTVKEILGCIFMISAVVLSQIHSTNFNKKLGQFLLHSQEVCENHNRIKIRK